MQQFSMGVQDELPQLLRRIAKTRATCSPHCIRYPDELKRDISRWVKHNRLNSNEAEKKLGVPSVTLRTWLAATPPLRVVEVESQQPLPERERVSHEYDVIQEEGKYPNIASSQIIEVVLGSQARIRLPLSALNPDLLQTFASLR